MHSSPNDLPAARKVAHADAGSDAQGKTKGTKKPRKTSVLRGSGSDFASLRIDQVPEAGVEPAHGITHTGF